jgi:hypothetical protein
MASGGAQAGMAGPRQQGAQSVDVTQSDLAAIDADQAECLQLRHRAHDGFQLQRQVVAGFGAGHRQRQCLSAAAQRLRAARHFQQEGHHALLGGQRGRRQHPVPVAADFTGQRRRQLLLAGGAGSEELLPAVFPHLADGKRDGVAGVAFQAEGIQAQQVAAHAEAGDLFPAVFARHAGLDDAGVDQVDRTGGLAGAEDVRLGPHQAAPRFEGKQHRCTKGSRGKPEVPVRRGLAFRLVVACGIEHGGFPCWLGAILPPRCPPSMAEA